MIRILITGANSYIGTSLEGWLEAYPDKYRVDTVDMTMDIWKQKDFSEYQVVFHVAGIAHVSSDPKMEALYDKVNTDLAIETAKKAKSEGVRQFVFMSSIIVYGESGRINRKRVIDRDTVPTPVNSYGKSKLKAEEGLGKLKDEHFKVVVVRSPMIYGKGSKGNYPKLARMAQKLPLFPGVVNERSMLHRDNMCEFIRLIIEHEESGLFFPQNKEYVKTSEMVRQIAEVHGKKMRLTKVFNPILQVINQKITVINKVFGNLVYEKSMSEYKENYRVCDFAESIRRTE